MEEQTKKKVKPVNSRAKGAGYENVIAKLLSKELAPMNFIRTQGSGARVGGKNFATIGKMFGEELLKAFVGDVVPTNEREISLSCRVSVETKFYKEQDHFTSIMLGKSKVFEWMKESEVDAVKVNKIPIIIFKWNNTPNFVASSCDEFPIEATKMTLVRDDGSKIFVATLEELLKPEYRSFWIKPGSAIL